MNSKKIATILNLIEIADNNLKTAKSLLTQLGGSEVSRPASHMSTQASVDESDALEVVEGYFDGESMIGDNGQTYLIPPNYASKTQLVLGDRMKWILTTSREIFKLIQPALRERATGTFTVEDDRYLVIVDKHPNPVQILKASATYAMKNLGLQVGDEVAITIPKDSTPTWGAFNSIVKSHGDDSLEDSKIFNNDFLSDSNNQSDDDPDIEADDSEANAVNSEENFL
ncbi:MAG: hypothetical protein HC932_01475 [Thermales bacterium]|nr:hypothetical protein [Thermales bacterium]